MTTSPDLHMAECFLACLDRSAVVWTFQTFDDTPAKRAELARTLHGTFQEHAKQLSLLNKLGAGVFVTVNETDGKGRTADNIIRVRAVFADFDDPQHDTLERLRSAPKPPSMIVQSSEGKWHAYWLIQGLGCEGFRGIQKAIAAYWGSDPKVCDLPRVMRLPGFLHHKDKPQPVRLLGSSGQGYGLELVELYCPKTENAKQTVTPDPIPPGELRAYAAAALTRACQSVAGAKLGTRNDTLIRKAFGIGQLVAGGEIPAALACDRLREAALAAGLDNCEAARTIQNGITAGAKQPRTVPATMNAADYLDDLDDESELPNLPKSSVLRAVALDDIMTAVPDPVHYAVKPWLPRRHVTLFGGHGGVGKSSLALAIAAHVACGKPFAGLEVEPLPVLFLSLEDEASIVRFRLRRIIEVYQLQAEWVLANLRLLDGTQGVAALMTESEGFNAVPLMTPAFRELKRHANGAGLIMIDNASDAFDANENSRRTVRTFVRHLADLAREQDAAVILLAHIDKWAARGGANGNNYSGSTAWHNSVRSRIALIHNEGCSTLEHEKANLSALAEPLSIMFVEGVPVPARDARCSTQSGEDYDQDAILQLMADARTANVTIPASLCPGAHSAMKALSLLPEYPKTFTGRSCNNRVARALQALISAGKIKRVTYRNSDRKERERLELVEKMDVNDNPANINRAKPNRSGAFSADLEDLI